MHCNLEKTLEEDRLNKENDSVPASMSQCQMFCSSSSYFLPICDLLYHESWASQHATWRSAFVLVESVLHFSWIRFVASFLWICWSHSDIGEAIWGWEGCDISLLNDEFYLGSLDRSRFEESMGSDLPDAPTWSWWQFGTPGQHSFFWDCWWVFFLLLGTMTMMSGFWKIIECKDEVMI